MNTSDWNQRLLEKAARLEQSLAESFFDGNDRFVDPWEAYTDSLDGFWRPIHDTSGGGHSTADFDEAALTAIRNQSRNLAATNEFAINAIENRINYIVGSGHKYHAVPVDECDLEISGLVQGFLARFLDENQWARRHQEIVRRRDRDGEVFVRFFVQSDGMTQIRFVEPAQVTCPQNYKDRPEHAFGIHTQPLDAESVLGYWIDGKYTMASSKRCYGGSRTKRSSRKFSRSEASISSPIPRPPPGCLNPSTIPVTP